MTTTTEAGGMEAGREPGQTAFEAYWQDDAHSAWAEGRVHADTKALWARVETALATARPAITEAMIEAACRAAVAAEKPNADADLQVPRLDGGTCTIWELFRHMVEPALKAALDRDTIPVGYVVVPLEPTEAMVHYGGCAFDHPSVYMGGPSQHGQKAVRRIWRAMTHAAAPQSKEAK